MSQTQNLSGFAALGLPKPTLDTLNRLGFTTPTPIQERAIPVVLEGRDVVGIAQTGTGKTLAFGLPMLSNLQPGEAALVLAPTRELAQQIQEALHIFGVRTALLIGGASMRVQINQLRARPDVIVATPGRYLDHQNQRNLHLKRIGIVVLDEADRMFDLGFAPVMREILSALREDRQTLLFSATMPEEVRDLSRTYQKDPVSIEIERPGTTAELVDQELVVLPHPDKQDMLARLLGDHDGTVLVFARTRHGARKLASTVRRMGHAAGELHADRTLAQRREALRRFKEGHDRVLVATDIAARGIDVKGIQLVVNFDLPDNPEDYVHRIGRTGRAGIAGKAITFATPEQSKEIRQLEKILKTEIRLSEISPMKMERPVAHPGRPQGGGFRRGPGGPNGGGFRSGGNRSGFRPRGNSAPRTAPR